MARVRIRETLFLLRVRAWNSGEASSSSSPAVFVDEVVVIQLLSRGPEFGSVVRRAGNRLGQNYLKFRPRKACYWRTTWVGSRSGASSLEKLKWAVIPATKAAPAGGGRNTGIRAIAPLELRSESEFEYDKVAISRCNIGHIILSFNQIKYGSKSRPAVPIFTQVSPIKE
jgi:hypothetical protein